VRNRYRKLNICIAFVIAAALSMKAQSYGIAADGQVKVHPQGNPAQLLLTARLDESPVVGSASDVSELPDAPSTAKPDTSTADPATPAVRRESSHGAPPAAQGGPLWVDRSVADRNYLLVTGGMIGASIVNTELTMRCFTKHASCNDVPSFFQRRLVLYGIGLPADLGVAYLTYYMKRKHSHLWYVPAAVVTGANVFLGYRAYHWTQQ